MIWVRIGFVGAFLFLLVGGYAARNAVAPYFSEAGGPPSPPSLKTPQVDAGRVSPPTATAIVVTATPTPAPSATPRVIVITPVPTASPVHRTRTRLPVRRAGVHHTPTAVPTLAPTRTPVPTATPLPTLVPATGNVALSNYWVNSRSARPGQVIAIGYVIRNDTGRNERIMLGASLKARSAPSWTEAINDTYHDVVAVVPPGATVHVRYFALPVGLHPGEYDVAWGLRDAATGRRLGLAFAPSVVTVSR